MIQQIQRVCELATHKGHPYSPYPNRAFPTEVFFGDVHVHTALSADAGGGRARLLPRDLWAWLEQRADEQRISKIVQAADSAWPWVTHKLVRFMRSSI